MSTQTDVKAVSKAATGALGIGIANVAFPRIKGVYYSCSTGGTVTISDGSSTGPTLLTFVVPVGAANVAIPGEGIRCNLGDPFLTLTTAVGTITVFYG